MQHSSQSSCSKVDEFLAERQHNKYIVGKQGVAAVMLGRAHRC